MEVSVAQVLESLRRMQIFRLCCVSGKNVSKNVWMQLSQNDSGRTKTANCRF